MFQSRDRTRGAGPGPSPPGSARSRRPCRVSRGPRPRGAPSADKPSSRQGGSVGTSRTGRGRRRLHPGPPEVVASGGCPVLPVGVTRAQDLWRGNLQRWTGDRTGVLRATFLSDESRVGGPPSPGRRSLLSPQLSIPVWGVAVRGTAVRGSREVGFRRRSTRTTTRPCLGGYPVLPVGALVSMCLGPLIVVTAKVAGSEPHQTVRRSLVPALT